MGSDSRKPGADLRRPIHVVHVMTSLEPGGLENGVVNLANSLDPDRFRTSIICLERVGEFKERLHGEVTVECLEKPPGFRWQTGWKLGALLRDGKAVIMHTHNLGPLIYGFLARRIGGFRGAIVHGEHAQLREDEKTARRRWLRRIGYRTCGAIHTVSAGLRDELIAFGLPGGKIRVILNGVDCERFRPAAGETASDLRRSHELSESAFVVGMVGRFGAFKRHRRMIRAFDTLADSHPDLHLLLIGDYGPEKDRVLSLCAGSSHGDRIHWKGFQEDMAPWYRMMDLLAIPSENEGLSNAMLEAMASGVPCLANAACGAAEVIRDGENGWLCSIECAEDLARELDSVLVGRNGLGPLAGRARETAESRFSLGAMVEAYADFYETAAGGVSGPA